MRAASSMLRQHLFRYMGHVSAALILGGVDCCGPQLFTIYPHGSAAEVELLGYLRYPLYTLFYSLFISLFIYHCSLSRSIRVCFLSLLSFTHSLHSFRSSIFTHTTCSFHHSLHSPLIFSSFLFIPHTHSQPLLRWEAALLQR